MISLEYNNEKVIKEKESYTLIDDVQRVGGNNTALVHVDGRTRVQKKKIRDDGFITRYAIKMIVDFDERNILRNMFVGNGKTGVCTPILFTINEGNKRDTVCQVIDSPEQESYNEEEIIESIENVKGHPSQLGYNEEEILYIVTIVLQKLYN